MVGRAFGERDTPAGQSDLSVRVPERNGADAATSNRDDDGVHAQGDDEIEGEKRN